MTDDLFLSHPEMSELMRQLRALPRVLSDLAVTVARQGVRGRAGHTGRAVPASCPPVDLDALAAGQLLHWELYVAVRAVCEQRHVAYVPVGATPDEPAPRLWMPLAWWPDTSVGPVRPGATAPTLPAPPTTLELGQWLDKHLIPFAMTEYSQTMYVDILAAVRGCREAVDLPGEDVVVVTGARVAAANGVVLTADQVEKIAGSLGDIGRGLNRDRVRYLAKCGLEPAAEDGGTRFYRLGDVLAKHQEHRRNGKKGGEAA